MKTYLSFVFMSGKKQKTLLQIARGKRSISEAAQALGLEQTRVYQIEKGAFERLDFRTALKACQFYGVRLQDLDSQSGFPHWDSQAAWTFELPRHLIEYLHDTPEVVTDLEVAASEAGYTPSSKGLP